MLKCYFFKIYLLYLYIYIYCTYTYQLIRNKPKNALQLTKFYLITLALVNY